MHWIDPDSLPEIAGTLERFVINPHGEIDGFVLAKGADAPILVHTPPHMGLEITSRIKPRDTIAVRGVRPRHADLFAAVAVADNSGRWIVDNGPDDDEDEPGKPDHSDHKKKPDRRKFTVHGKVRFSLFGPKGELRGALLNDGTVIRVGPKEAKPLAKLLAPGADLAASGDGLETEHGRVVHAMEIGSTPDDLRPVKTAKPDDKKDKPKHGHEARA